MAKYDLDHLTQPNHQSVMGPIQDDEALLLYALIRCMRLKYVLEIGGQSGYSARNFCKAVGPDGFVWTVEKDNFLKPVAQNHSVVVCDAAYFDTRAFLNPIDLVFFDCHDFYAQMRLLERLEAGKLIADETLLVLHDTNLHTANFTGWSTPNPDGAGWIHQQAERQMVSELTAKGWSPLHVHSRLSRHDEAMPYRHGLSILSRGIMR